MIPQLISMLQQQTGEFTHLITNINAKLGQEELEAKEESLQPDLNEIFETYKKALTTDKENVIAQLSLGKKIIEELPASQDDVSKLSTILTAYQTALQPLNEKHSELEEEVAELEGRIISLLPQGTLLVS